MKKILTILLVLTLMMTSQVKVSAITYNNEKETRECLIITNSNKIKKEVNVKNDKYTDNINDNNIYVCDIEDEKIQRNQSEIICVEDNITITGNGNINKALKKYNYNKQWNMEMVNAESEQIEYDIESDSKIKVAVIDSGIDWNEKINVKERYNLIPEEEGVSVLYDDTTGHGTAVAGIIATNNDEKNGIKGINDAVELYSIKVLDKDNQAPLSRIVEAIYKAIEYDVDIINMSFGTTQYSEILHKAIKDASDSGILLVASSGNSGEEIEYPAAFDEVVSVGSVNSKAETSEFCVKDDNVEVLAPGEQISTVGFCDSIVICSGTSMAAPHVVGMASVLWQKDKSKTPDFIRRLIQETSNICNSNISGIIDLGYALYKYDEFSKKYDESNYKTEQNTKEIETYEVPEIVKAQWSKDNHAAFVVTGLKDFNGKGYSSTQIALIRIGLRLNDQLPQTAPGAHPDWHAIGTDSNYVTNADFISRVIKTKDCNQDNVSIAGKYSTQQKGIQSDLKNIDWNYEFKYGSCKGYTKNDTNKRFILWGMTMHLVTDAYAHRAWKKSGSSWVQITDRDNPKAVPLRFSAAKKVVRNVMEQCISTDNPYNSKEFKSNQMALSSEYYNGSTFKLRRLGLYAVYNLDISAVKLPTITQLMAGSYLTESDHKELAALIGG